jgi:thiol-disulfide isomerase/thioredoxin
MESKNLRYYQEQDSRALRTLDIDRIKFVCFTFMILFITHLLPGESCAAPLKKGDMLPRSTLSSLLGDSFDSELLKGRFLYLDFWASWCPPCRLTLPFMNGLHEEFDSKKLRIIAVSVDDDEPSMMSALTNVQPKYTVLRDKDKTLVGQIDPPKMPTSYLINQEGEVIYVHEGFKSGDEEVVREKIREVLSN